MLTLQVEEANPTAHLWFVQKCGVEQFQLQLNGLVVTNRVRGGAIKHMQQHTAATAKQGGHSKRAAGQ